MLFETIVDDGRTDVGRTTREINTYYEMLPLGRDNLSDNKLVQVNLVMMHMTYLALDLVVFE